MVYTKVFQLFKGYWSFLFHIYLFEGLVKTAMDLISIYYTRTENTYVYNGCADQLARMGQLYILHKHWPSRRGWRLCIKFQLAQLIYAN